MLGEPEYNMNELFAQLGLDSSDAAIDSFIENNQLDRREVDRSEHLDRQSTYFSTRRMGKRCGMGRGHR